MGGCDGVRHVSRCSGLLHVKVSRAKVYQSDIKTDGGVMTGDARVTITEVTSELS
jgi:hypothetical protein